MVIDTFMNVLNITLIVCNSNLTIFPHKGKKEEKNLYKIMPFIPRRILQDGISQCYWQFYPRHPRSRITYGVSFFFVKDFINVWWKLKKSCIFRKYCRTVYPSIFDSFILATQGVEYWMECSCSLSRIL